MTESKALKIGGLLLAAGGSSRFGQPKQLLQFNGKSLIRRAAEALSTSGCQPVVAVLGAETDVSTAEIVDLPVHIRINEGWQAGMSSSIISGLETVLEIEPTLDAVLITLCDQPNVTADSLDAFLTQFRATTVPIVAAEYGDNVGVPALFSKDLFDELFQLEGDEGARKLIRNRNDIVTIQLEAAGFDIDTLDDIR